MNSLRIAKGSFVLGLAFTTLGLAGCAEHERVVVHDRPVVEERTVVRPAPVVREHEEVIVRP
jgi:hypothetical protein